MSPVKSKEKKKKAVKGKAASENKAKKSSSAKKIKSSGKSAKKSAAKRTASPGVRKTEAAKRDIQEEGSITPPTQRLVSAFSLFKSTRRAPSKGPTVTRIAAGGSLPKPPPAPPKASPGAPQPEASAAAPALPEKPTAPVKPSSSPPPSTLLPTSIGSSEAKAVPTYKEPAGASAIPSKPPPRPPFRAPPPRKPKSHQKAAAKTDPVEKVKPQASAPPAKAPPAQAALSLKKLKASTIMTVRELAEKMEVKPNDVIKKLMSLGVFATINQRLEPEAAAIVAQDFGFELELVAMYKEEELQIKTNEEEDPKKLKSRPPVVTVMGHVDHGKTSLLDAIRSTKVAEGESGGITQHIGAYKVATSKGEIIFLDTPGHEAFTAMRARGAKVTDLVILVVSATDGVMPQTIEAIDHAKAAGVPIIVAVNKIDLPGANPPKIRQELSKHGLVSEEWGGKDIFVDVSAKKHLHLDTLLEMVSLQALMLEVKANPDRAGYGVILEARMDPKKGSLATLLVQAGTVRIGDAFVAGLSHGRIKALHDEHGTRVDSAGPSIPVEIMGIIGTPQAGDVFSVVSSDRQAREIAEKRKIIHREQSLAHQKHVTLVGLKSQITGAAAKDLNLLIKADVQGSLQALKDSLENLATSECRVRLIHTGVGKANESDILLANASDAVILLFHSDIEPRAQELAAKEGVEVRKYEIIYELIEDVRASLEGLLEPEIIDVIVGKGEVLEIFNARGAKVAGIAVRDGKVVRGGITRVVRDGTLLHESKITTLKRFKDDAREVEKGHECGLTIEGFNEFQRGDILEFIVKESRTRRLSDSKK